MRKFKTKRTLRKERAAWVEYAEERNNAAVMAALDCLDARDALAATIEERNHWRSEYDNLYDEFAQLNADFSLMEYRYKGSAS